MAPTSPLVGATRRMHGAGIDAFGGHVRILTDHLRTSVFMLGDQSPVEPSNQGRG